MSRPPITTPFWIGDTVYKVHGNRDAGLVLTVSFRGDPAYPCVHYTVQWPKQDKNDDHFEIELTKTQPPKRQKEFA